MQTLASVPWFVVGVANALWGRLVEMVEDIPVIRDRLRRSRGSYGGYRTLSTDEDAEVGMSVVCVCVRAMRRDEAISSDDIGC